LRFEMLSPGKKGHFGSFKSGGGKIPRQRFGGNKGRGGKGGFRRGR